MNRLIGFIFLCLVLSTSLISQVPTFNLEFDDSTNYPKTESFPHGLVEIDSFYYVSGTTAAPCDTGLVLRLNKYDLSIKWIYMDVFKGSRIRHMILNDNSELIITGSKYNCALDSTDYFFSKIENDSIKPENTVFFGGPSRHEISNKLIQDSEMNYVSIGWNFKPGSGDGQGMTLFKADSDFNYLTYRHYPELDPGEIYAAEGIVETPDGGYIIVGGHTGEVASWSIWVATIFKVDSEGEIVWWQEFPPDFFDLDERVTFFSDIIRKQNGEYLVIGAKEIFPILGGPYVHKWTTSFDEDGNLLWEKSLIENRTSEWVKIKAASDGNYLVCGDDVIANDSLTGGSNRSATVGKITPNGEVIWQRYFDQGDLVESDPDIFWNVIETSDGGILCSGHTVPDAEQVQNFWLVKLDSLGCLIPGCDSTMVSTDPIILKPSDQLLVYPIPSQGQFNVTTESGDARITNISVISMAGQSVKLWSGSELSVEMDISKYPAGMYLVAAKIDGVIYLQQVLVQ